MNSLMHPVYLEEMVGEYGSAPNRRQHRGSYHQAEVMNDDDAEQEVQFGEELQPKKNSQRQLIVPVRALSLGVVGVTLVVVSLLWFSSHRKITPPEIPAPQSVADLSKAAAEIEEHKGSASVPGSVSPLALASVSATETQPLGGPVAAVAASREVPAVGESVEVSERLAKLQSEMDLMKKIVSGLVETIQTISRAQGGERGEGGASVAASAQVQQQVPTQALEEVFPFPVRVTTEKAQLRKSPSRDAPSLFEVTKNTTLMAFGGTDKWFKVNTPRGEDAWISRGIVVVEQRE